MYPYCRNSQDLITSRRKFISAGSGLGKETPPDFHGAGKTFRPCAAKIIGRNRGYLLYTSRKLGT